MPMSINACSKTELRLDYMPMVTGTVLYATCLFSELFVAVTLRQCLWMCVRNVRELSVDCHHGGKSHILVSGCSTPLLPSLFLTTFFMIVVDVMTSCRHMSYYLLLSLSKSLLCLTIFAPMNFLTWW